MNKEVYSWITNTSIVSPIIPLFVLLICWKKQPVQNLILAVSVFISLAFDLSGLALIEWSNPKFLCVSNNLYFITAFPAIMWFYHETLIKKPLKIIVRVFTCGFLVIALGFAFYYGLTVPNYLTMTLSSILVTLTSFFFVVDLNLMDQSNFLKNKFHETNIMLNTSLALYYFITIVLFAISDYIFSNSSVEDGRYLWAFHNVLNTFKHIGIAVAFYLSAKNLPSVAKSSHMEIHQSA